jgi:hypothetical protein
VQVAHDGAGKAGGIPAARTWRWRLSLAAEPRHRQHRSSTDSSRWL